MSDIQNSNVKSRLLSPYPQPRNQLFSRFQDSNVIIEKPQKESIISFTKKQKHEFPHIYFE